MKQLTCQYWMKLYLFSLIISSTGCYAAAYLEGSTVKCYNEGQDIEIPLVQNDPCYRCKCLSTEIVCLDTCGHKKCHLNGKTYKHNEMWNNGTCTKCSCKNGDVSCEQVSCSPVKCGPRDIRTTRPGECCPSCVQVNSQCSINGPPLVTRYRDAPRTISTFDGVTYKFNGKCNYVLTRDCDDRSFTVHLVQDPLDSSVPTRSRDHHQHIPQSHRVSSLSNASDDGWTRQSNQLTHLSPSSSLSTRHSLVNESTRVSAPFIPARRSARQTLRGLYSPWIPASSSSASASSKSQMVRKISVSLVIKIDGTKVRLTPSDGPDVWKIRHGRKDASLPFIQPGVITVVKESATAAAARSTNARPSVLVYTAKGIKVTWNGVDNLSIVVPSKMQDTLCGLCGNYNGNRRDDVTPRKGTRSKSIRKFVDSWKVGANGFCPKRHVIPKPAKLRAQRLPLIDT